MRGVVIAAVLSAALGSLSLGASCAVAAPSLMMGFNDEAFLSGFAPDRQADLDHVVDARGSIVRLNVSWSGVGPERPPSVAAARDPGWAGYNWGSLDGAVRDASARGLAILIMLHSAPAWAEGRDRPPVSRDAAAGTWRPSIAAFHDFTVAAVRRYSGSFADPAMAGQTLPQVRYWQAWNEPNLATYLSPQWIRRGGRYLPASPAYYRLMLNAFYRGVKSSSPSNRVISAGTSPYGEPIAGRWRMPPAFFTRELLCVEGRVHPRPQKRCPGGPVLLDAIAHHPYSFGPRRKAHNPDDVAAPDMWKLTRPLAAAQRAGYVRPRGNKQLWITETSWDSSPPDPNGLPEARQALWLEALMFVLWQQGADVVTWWNLRDEAEGAGWAYSLQSGIFFRGPTVAQDRPKLSYTTFRFPFTAYTDHGVATLWGLAPQPGAVVTIEAQRADGDPWVRVKQLRAGGNRIYLGRYRAARGTLLRARSGGELSMPWEIGRSPMRLRGVIE